LGNQTDPKSWLWPTNGRVHRTFVAGDPARNGLDIAGREGQAIKASSGGYVVYSGQGLIGYGELIIIKHSENMLSAYAHNKVRLVHEGDQVSAGQKIAEMGRNPSGEQLLHFEVRSRGKPVNPLNYLPKK
jgi:lipoprotein NlpD